MPLSPNVSGQAYALMVLTPIVPGREQELRDVLESYTEGSSPFARLPRTHFGRWVILDDFVHDEQQPKPDRLTSKYLIFTSNFDGKRDSYLEELCELPEAREIWSHCVGAPTSGTRAELAQYLRHNQITTGFFVAAYPKATVPQVKASLERRAALVEFAIDAQAMDAGDLKREFEKRF
jgi:hypothetical protein